MGEVSLLVHDIPGLASESQNLVHEVKNLVPTPGSSPVSFWTSSMRFQGSFTRV